MSNGGGSRVSIPSATRKMIQNIKEITGNHSDEEIYAMLKECEMDPNETAQKLLFQDTFHEVKRKRDRKKENPNKDLAEPRWKSGTQGRGSRGGRVNYIPRHMSHDAGGGRNSGPGKENGTHQVVENVSATSLPIFQESKNKENTTASSATVMADGPADVPSAACIGSVCASESSAGRGLNLTKSNLPSGDANKLENASTATVNAKKAPNIVFGSEDTSGQAAPVSSDSSVSKTPESSSAVCFSSLDPVLVPSSDSRSLKAVGTIKREVGSQRTNVEPSANAFNVNKSLSVSNTGGTSSQEIVAVKSSGVMKNQLSEMPKPASASGHESSSGSRPSSSYSNQKQQFQKVNSNKEWKPKSTNSGTSQQPVIATAPEDPAISIDVSGQSQPVSCVLNSEEETSRLEKKLEQLHLPQRQHVILPNYIHVPESQRSKLSFGSFGASFGLPTDYGNIPEIEKSSTPKSETSPVAEEAVEGQHTSNQNAQTSSEEGVYPDTTQSPADTPEAPPTSEVDTSSVPVCDNSQPKQEPELVSGGLQYSVVHTSPNYSAGIVPPMLGGQLIPTETSESQAREVSCIPNIIVQPQFDPASYYAQFYRAGADVDGRISPLTAPGIVAGNYVGNVAVFPQQISQSQEAGNSLVLSTAAPTPLVTQAAGLMQSSVAMTQQPVPVFRPPPGMPLSQFPANYIPYGHYLPPFYVASPGIHQFFGNSAFPSQPQAASVYPTAPPAPASAVKYPVPPFKSGSNTGSSAHIGVPSAYGLYGSSPAGYNPGSAPAGNSTTNEDLSASQFKESNVYVAGQQNEGSAVWISAPGRDISSLPAGSYYGLPPQGGQHVTFAPTQANHGTFAGLYHPGQAVTAAPVHSLVQQSQGMAGAVDMVGAPPSVYQQHAQTNWPNNF